MVVSMLLTNQALNSSSDPLRVRGPAVRSDRHRPYAAGVAAEGVAMGAGDRIPDPHRAVSAAGGQPAAVRGDRHRQHAVGVAGEAVAFGAGDRIPDPRRTVAPDAGGGQPAAGTRSVWPVRVWSWVPVTGLAASRKSADVCTFGPLECLA